MTKAEKIKQARQETRERRKTQTCKVYTCKIDSSHLSKRKHEYLERLFLEAKWFRNFLIANANIFEDTYKYSEVFILNKDKETEAREIRFLSAQMRQCILHQLQANIRGLATSKEKGHKVGKLKFKSQVNSINLSQFNRTHKLYDNHVSFQNFKGRFRVRGLKQIPADAEIANAKLIRKESGYYIAITCFVPKEERVKTCKEVGFDFGIETHITDSEGHKSKWNFQETKRHKCLQRKVNKTYRTGKKSSNNREKRKRQCRLYHEKNSNKKKDAINKFVSKVNKEYDFIGVQDENIAAWRSSRMKGWGRSVHYSIMGGIIGGIKKLPQTQIVDKWEPTTQICLMCGERTKHKLDQRVFICSHCNHQDDRDTHSAKVVLAIAKRFVRSCTNTMPVERIAPTVQPVGVWQAASMKQEAACVASGSS